MSLVIPEFLILIYFIGTGSKFCCNIYMKTLTAFISSANSEIFVKYEIFLEFSYFVCTFVKYLRVK